jgi:Domain of unknown function (DUF1772)
VVGVVQLIRNEDDRVVHIALADPSDTAKTIVVEVIDPAPRLYVRLHRTLYPTFGKTAGPAEAVAVASTAALAWIARRQDRRSSRLTVAAAGCLAAAHGIFWSVVQPANIEMMRWPLDAIPPDWATWHNRWEYGHAVRAGLVTTALAALTGSVLRDVGVPVN